MSFDHFKKTRNVVINHRRLCTNNWKIVGQWQSHHNFLYIVDISNGIAWHCPTFFQLSLYTGACGLLVGLPLPYGLLQAPISLNGELQHRVERLLYRNFRTLNPDPSFWNSILQMGYGTSIRTLLLFIFYFQTERDICYGCGDLIIDRHLLKVNDRHWHVHCLRCSICQTGLDRDTSCYIKDGNVFCKNE